MKIRERDNPDEVGWAMEFNPDVMDEILVNFPLYSTYEKIADYEFYVESIGAWVSSDRLFGREEKLVIVNKYNTAFLEPKTEEDRQRGYEL